MLNLDDFYFCSQAAEVISRNSGHEVKPAYVRRLVMLGALSPIRVGGRNLYHREIVGRIVVGKKHQRCEDNIA